MRVAPKLLAEFNTMREREANRSYDPKDDKKKEEAAISLVCLNCIGLCIELLVPHGLDATNRFLEELLGTKPEGTTPSTQEGHLSIHMNRLQVRFSCAFMGCMTGCCFRIS